jgi:hypothetical protein
VKAFVVHADSYVGKNVALWLKDNQYEVRAKQGATLGCLL